MLPVRYMRRLAGPVLLAAALCMPAFSRAQKAGDTDFGLWVSAEASYKLLPKFEISLGEELRTAGNVSRIDQLKTTLGFSYKVNKYFKAGFGYIMKNCRDTDLSSGWEFRHRYFVYARGSYKWGRVNFALREYLQGTHRMNVSAKVNPQFYSKTRLSVEWDIRKSPFTPYVSAEVYAALNDPQLKGMDAFDRIRYTLGTEIKIDKHNSLDIFARLISSRDWKPKRRVFEVENRALLSVGYAYSF